MGDIPASFGSFWMVSLSTVFHNNVYDSTFLTQSQDFRKPLYMQANSSQGIYVELEGQKVFVEEEGERVR